MNDKNDQQQFNLISIVKTKHDADVFVGKLEELIDAFYNIKTNTTEKMNEILPYEMKEQLTELLQKKKIAIDNIQSVQTFLIELKKQLLALPTITLHLAFEPTKASIDAFSEWINRNTAPPHPNPLPRREREREYAGEGGILIEINLDRNLIAGAALEYNGKYKEYSVKKKLEELYSKGELTLN